MFLFSTYERLLDAKLREMEQNIRIILPKPSEYRWVLLMVAVKFVFMIGCSELFLSCIWYV